MEIFLKLLLLATTALGFGTVSAIAADIAIAPKAPPAIINSWAGFYLGVHGGYGWGDNDFSTNLNFSPIVSIGGIKSQGAVYGGHAGYNWQYGRAVAGVELDFSGTDIKGTAAASVTIPSQPPVTISDSRTDEIKYLGTARARLGWLPTDSVLLYGTAGLAWERVDRTETQVQSAVVGGLPASITFAVRNPFDRFGWVAGAGAEAALWNSNWVGRIEYLHYDFGITEPAAFSNSPPNPVLNDRSGRQTIDVVRAGLSYKFGVFGSAPSVLYAKVPVAAVPSSWAGFYLGVHGGYGWGDDRFSRLVDVNQATPAATFANGIKSAGWVAGGHVGHNWQFDRVVAGLELDLSGADIGGSSTSPSAISGNSVATFTETDKIKYLGTARGRLGWLPTGNVLLYGTAGLAWERIEQTETEVRTQAGVIRTNRNTDPFDRFGWVAGAGAEALISGTNWLARIEYLHYDFGRASTASSVSFINVGGPDFSFAGSSGHQTIDVVRAGVSYKFGDPALGTAVPYAKAPRLAPPSTWAGFYLGAHGGYGWGDNDFSFDQQPGRLDGIASKGWVAGGQAGYNWQYGRVVTGLEADFSVAGIKGSSDTFVGTTGTTFLTLSDNVKYLGTSRGRLGWLPLDHVLLYGTAGLAWERVNRTTTFTDISGVPATFASTSARDQFGWVAGVGAETILWNSNWIARLEYLHYDFGTVESTFSNSSSNPAFVASSDRGGRHTIDVVRAGVSYKFGANGPVVANY